MKFVIHFVFLALLVFSFSSCNSATDTEATTGIEMPAFPTYDIIKHGAPAPSTSLHHQNCCECQAGGCTAKKCCSGTNGGNCACTCIDGFWSDSCTCSGCSNQATFALWLDEGQFHIWEEFASILSVEESPQAVLVMEGHLRALAAVEANDEQEFYQGKAEISENVAQLQDETKTQLNEFLDRYGFEDERL